MCAQIPSSTDERTTFLFLMCDGSHSRKQGDLYRDEVESEEARTDR